MVNCFRKYCIHAPAYAEGHIVWLQCTEASFAMTVSWNKSYDILLQTRCNLKPDSSKQIKEKTVSFPLVLATPWGWIYPQLKLLNSSLPFMVGRLEIFRDHSSKSLPTCLPWGANNPGRAGIQSHCHSKPKVQNDFNHLLLIVSTQIHYRAVIFAQCMIT